MADAEATLETTGFDAGQSAAVIDAQQPSIEPVIESPVSSVEALETASLGSTIEEQNFDPIKITERVDQEVQLVTSTAENHINAATPNPEEAQESSTLLALYTGGVQEARQNFQQQYDLLVQEPSTGQIEHVETIEGELEDPVEIKAEPEVVDAEFTVTEPAKIETVVGNTDEIIDAEFTPEASAPVIDTIQPVTIDIPTSPIKSAELGFDTKPSAEVSPEIPSKPEIDEKTIADLRASIEAEMRNKLDAELKIKEQEALEKQRLEAEIKRLAEEKAAEEKLEAEKKAKLAAEAKVDEALRKIKELEDKAAREKAEAQAKREREEAERLAAEKKAREEKEAADKLEAEEKIRKDAEADPTVEEPDVKPEEASTEEPTEKPEDVVDPDSIDAEPTEPSVESEEGKTEVPPTPEAGDLSIKEILEEAEVEKNLLPSNRGVWNKLKGAGKRFFIKTVAQPFWKAKSSVKSVNERLIQSNIDKLERNNPLNLLNKTEALLNSKLISRMEQGWVTERGSLSNLKERYDIAKRQADVLTAKYKKANDEMEALFKKNPAMEYMRPRFELRLQDIQKSINKAETEAGKLKNAYNTQYDKMVVYRERRDSLIAELQLDIETNLGPLESKINSMQQVLDKQNKIIESYEKAKATLETSKADLEKALVDSVFASDLAPEIKELTARIQKANQIIIDKKQYISLDQQRFNDLTARARPWREMRDTMDKQKSIGHVFKKID